MKLENDLTVLFCRSELDASAAIRSKLSERRRQQIEKGMKDKRSLRRQIDSIAMRYGVWLSNRLYRNAVWCTTRDRLFTCMLAYTHSSAGYDVGPSGFDVELPSVMKTAAQCQGVKASLQKPAMNSPSIGFNMPRTSFWRLITVRTSRIRVCNGCCLGSSILLRVAYQTHKIRCLDGSSQVNNQFT